jgi:hypothetical protein
MAATNWPFTQYLGLKPGKVLLILKTLVLLGRDFPRCPISSLLVWSPAYFTGLAHRAASPWRWLPPTVIKQARDKALSSHKFLIISNLFIILHDTDNSGMGMAYHVTSPGEVAAVAQFLNATVIYSLCCYPKSPGQPLPGLFYLTSK